MKYIFTIHSHITFLSALAVVEYDMLDKKDVIFICSNYIPPIREGSKIKLLKSLDEVESKYGFFKRIASINYNKGTDNYIDRLVHKDSFIAYIDLMSVFNRFLVTNPLCKQFHFIEEGIVNYGDFDSFRMLTMDLDNFNWRLSYKKHYKEIVQSVYRIIRGRSLRILNLPIHPNIYAFFEGVFFYGFSEYTYPNIPESKKKVISFSLVRQELETPTISEKQMNNAYIWIGDSMCTHYKIAKNHFQEAIHQLLENINVTTNKSIFIKYRGTESEDEREVLESTLKKYNFKIQFLPKDTVVELVFMNFKNLTVFGNGSSLLIYAKLMGHNTHSIFPYIPNIYNIPFATDYKSVHKLLNFK